MEKVALITGAAGGLGRSVAKRLAETGWQLILVSRYRDRLAHVYGGDHLQVTAGLLDRCRARQIIEIASA
ncbi:MAG: SDR family NAD(P)-dependent oxidoreductase [Candidatus Accumulibacter sp.]|uniref:SDR family NAD(P)-dependent oxidoreductase n=1 Tax=Candidatus Accumulibacter proximus TaxID=2954385 RepID=A0A935Q0Q4_9PROT|nr:SDR family NAD(P)-dependent oxidoreductase [Candidatus Accumulibacter proximus]